MKPIYILSLRTDSESLRTQRKLLLAKTDIGKNSLLFALSNQIRSGKDFGLSMHMLGSIVDSLQVQEEIFQTTTFLFAMLPDPQEIITMGGLISHHLSIAHLKIADLGQLTYCATPILQAHHTRRELDPFISSGGTGFWEQPGRACSAGNDPTMLTRSNSSL